MWTSHPCCIHILYRSLKWSVRRTWTGSTLPHQWECLKCTCHGLSVSCVKWHWGPVTLSLQALSLVEKAEPVQVCITLHSRDQQSKWMQGGCGVYMDSYMVSNGLCFIITWIVFKNHLWEVGLPPKTGRSWHTKPHNHWFIKFWSYGRTLLEWKLFGIAFGWRHGHIWLHTTLEGP